MGRLLYKTSFVVGRLDLNIFLDYDLDAHNLPLLQLTFKNGFININTPTLYIHGKAELFLVITSLFGIFNEHLLDFDHSESLHPSVFIHILNGSDIKALDEEELAKHIARYNKWKNKI